MVFNNDVFVGVVIFIGFGEKFFVVGVDIKEFVYFFVEEGKQLVVKGQELLFDYIENMFKLVIVVINGFVLGGGLEFVMVLYICIVFDNVKLGLLEVLLGVIFGYGGMQWFIQFVGCGKVNEMIFMVGMIIVDEVKFWGLVNYVMMLEELLLIVQKIVFRIFVNFGMVIVVVIIVVNVYYSKGG